MLDKKETGIIGEEIAARYLRNCGYIILEKNYRSRFGEADIIAKDSRYIVFIEVKTRHGIRFGLPRESVDIYKQNRIICTAGFYMAKMKFYESPARFDVVEVILDANDKMKSVSLIKNAFE